MTGNPPLWGRLDVITGTPAASAQNMTGSIIMLVIRMTYGGLTPFHQALMPLLYMQAVSLHRLMLRVMPFRLAVSGI